MRPATGNSDGSSRRASDTPSEPSRRSLPPPSPTHLTLPINRSSPSSFHPPAAAPSWPVWDEQARPAAVGSEWLAGPAARPPTPYSSERHPTQAFQRVEVAEIDRLPLTDRTGDDVVEQTRAWYQLLSHRNFGRSDPVRPAASLRRLTCAQALVAHLLRSQLRRTVDGRVMIHTDDLRALEASFVSF